MTISQETRDLACDLYVRDGLSFEEVAEKTGVSAANLKRWAKRGNWTKRREESRKQSEGLQGGLIQLRDRMLEKALENLDPQYSYALVAIQKLLSAKLEPAIESDGEPEKKMTKEELLAFIKEKVYGL